MHCNSQMFYLVKIATEVEIKSSEEQTQMIRKSW